MKTPNMKLQSSHTGADGKRYETWTDDNGDVYTRGSDGKLTRAKNQQSGLTLVASVNRGGHSEKIFRDQSGQLFHQVGDDQPEAITKPLASAIRQGWQTHRPSHREQ